MLFFVQLKWFNTYNWISSLAGHLTRVSYQRNLCPLAVGESFLWSTAGLFISGARRKWYQGACGGDRMLGSRLLLETSDYHASSAKWIYLLFLLQGVNIVAAMGAHLVRRYVTENDTEPDPSKKYEFDPQFGFQERHERGLSSYAPQLSY